MSTGFERLHPNVQRWVFKQGWEGLRDIQEEAIEPVLSQKCDLVISAATASGKTEAFFLPALSVIANQEEGIGIIYISPLKALINDQYRRLKELSEMLDLPVTPWHGDAAQSQKNKLRQSPAGVLLITPESLEASLMLRPGWVESALHNLKYIVIDEFHAFIGVERGHHLLSILNRIDQLLDRGVHPVPRVALSATLGNIDTVAGELRPGQSLPCTIINSDASLTSIKLQLRGYENPGGNTQDRSKVPAINRIAADIYELCRGDSHLVFANSRKNTEMYASSLSDMCEEAVVPNEFFPHHGSLSKELRETLEVRLQQEKLPTTAVCTMTLELGIDIGKVKSVVQVTAPPSVASMRQRLGRSGRRGEAAILRLLIPENQIIQNTGLADALRLNLFQSITMVKLLLEHKWFEPPQADLYHFSTLVHQILATLVQYGGVRAGQLYKLLCHQGPFRQVSVDQFKMVLSGMGDADLITQLHSGEFVLGKTGEQVSGHYSFYAVFQTPEEYRITTRSKTLGSIPADNMLLVGQIIIFAGRRWHVDEIIKDKKTIVVSPAKGGIPPIFRGERMMVADRVRDEMRKLYLSGKHGLGEGGTPFLNDEAIELFDEGQKTFQQYELERHCLVTTGSGVSIVSWKGDRVINTIAAMLNGCEIEAASWAGVIEVANVSKNQLESVLREMAGGEEPDATELAHSVPMKHAEKYDEYLDEAILSEGYGRKTFDTQQAHKWLKEEFS